VHQADVNVLPTSIDQQLARCSCGCNGYVKLCITVTDSTTFSTQASTSHCQLNHRYTANYICKAMLTSQLTEDRGNMNAPFD